MTFIRYDGHDAGFSRSCEVGAQKPAAVDEHIVVKLVHARTDRVLGLHTVAADATPTAADCLALAEELYELCQAASSSPTSPNDGELIVHVLRAAHAARVAAAMSQQESAWDRGNVFAVRLPDTATVRAAPKPDIRKANVFLGRAPDRTVRSLRASARPAACACMPAPAGLLTCICQSTALPEAVGFFAKER